MKRSRDVPDANQIAHKIVKLATENKTETLSPAPAAKRRKNRAAVALGRRGGKKGGNVRAKSLTPERLSEIARMGAKARWEKYREGTR